MEGNLVHEVKQNAKHWWAFLLVGIVSIALGLYCLSKPADALVSLTMVFVIGFFISGIFEIIFSIVNKNVLDGWGWMLAGGILDLLFGIILIALPLPIITTILVYYVGFWILFRSIWSLGVASDLSKYTSSGWLIVLAVLGILFSFFYLLSPTFYGGITLVALLCAALIAYGLLRIYMAFQLKSMNKKINN